MDRVHGIPLPISRFQGFVGPTYFVSQIPLLSRPRPWWTTSICSLCRSDLLHTVGISALGAAVPSARSLNRFLADWKFYE